MPLQRLAEQYDVAIVLVRHLRKSGGHDPVHRGTGSIAIIALVRAALVVGNDSSSENAHRHIASVCKSNLASAPSQVYQTVRNGDGG